MKRRREKSEHQENKKQKHQHELLPIQYLPKELFGLVFSFLNCKQLINCALCCKEFHSITQGCNLINGKKTHEHFLVLSVINYWKQQYLYPSWTMLQGILVDEGKTEQELLITKLSMLYEARRTVSAIAFENQLKQKLYLQTQNKGTASLCDESNQHSLSLLLFNTALSLLQVDKNCNKTRIEILKFENEKIDKNQATISTVRINFPKDSNCDPILLHQNFSTGYNTRESCNDIMYNLILESEKAEHKRSKSLFDLTDDKSISIAFIMDYRGQIENSIICKPLLEMMASLMELPDEFKKKHELLVHLFAILADIQEDTSSTIYRAVAEKYTNIDLKDKVISSRFQYARNGIVSFENMTKFASDTREYFQTVDTRMISYFSKVFEQFCHYLSSKIQCDSYPLIPSMQDIVSLPGNEVNMYISQLNNLIRFLTSRTLRITCGEYAIESMMKSKILLVIIQKELEVELNISYRDRPDYQGDTNTDLSLMINTLKDTNNKLGLQKETSCTIFRVKNQRQKNVNSEVIEKLKSEICCTMKDGGAMKKLSPTEFALLLCELCWFLSSSNHLNERVQSISIVQTKRSSRYSPFDWLV